MNMHDTKYKEFSRYIQQQRRGDDSVARTQSISSIDDAGMYAPRSFDANSKLSKKKRKRKSFIGVLIALVVLFAAAFAGLFVYVNMMSGKLHFGIDSDLVSSLDGGSVSEPFYMLILGTDASQTRKDSGEYGDTWRADSIILTRIDPEKQSVTFISIPRDAYVDIEGYGPNKINAAFAFGGPALMVRTVSEFAGVPIDHYMQVDFDGFKEIVDALGGVEVDVPIDIDDAHTGKLSAGKQTLTGEQALILARSRHAYDNYGDGDGYRASNQRMILGAIAKKVLNSDAATMASTISSLSNYITTDLSVKDIMALVTSMSKLKSGNMLSASCPTGGYYLNETWYEICFLDEWQSIMGRVDAGLPPYEEEDKNKNIGGVVDVEEDLSGESFTNTQEDGYEATNENLSNSYNYDYDASYDESYY